MGHDRLRPSDSEAAELADQSRRVTSSTSPVRPRSGLVLLLLLVPVIVIAVLAAGAAMPVQVRSKRSLLVRSEIALNSLHRKPSLAISRTCGKTRFPSLCVSSLLEVPNSHVADEMQLVHLSFNITLHRFTKALYAASMIDRLQMRPRERAAYDDCLELLDDSVYALGRALSSVSGSASSPGARRASSQDILTWLSAAMTNQDTCSEGLEGVTGSMKDQLTARLKDLSELVSNCLAIFSTAQSDDFSGVPIQNRRRRLMAENGGSEVFPAWLSRKERRLLDMPVTAIRADMVVSQDGNGTFKTITEAIKKAPEYSNRRIIIYVRAGR